jgi:hypothetical protein
MLQCRDVHKAKASLRLGLARGGHGLVPGGLLGPDYWDGKAKIF